MRGSKAASKEMQGGAAVWGWACTKALLVKSDRGFPEAIYVRVFFEIKKMEFLKVFESFEPEIFSKRWDGCAGMAGWEWLLLGA